MEANGQDAYQTSSATATAIAVQSRDIPLTRRTAVLVIDMQNEFAHELGAVWRRVDRTPYIQQVLRMATSNIADILAAARASRIEVIFTVVEALTNDGRERSLDYKVSGFLIPRGSWGAQVLDSIRPSVDEILLPKGSSSVFISTNLAYILRNLGMQQVVIVGGLTDQCVDSAVRDACDLGFLVTTVVDACYTHTEERHLSALSNNAGYTRQVNTATVIEELKALATCTVNVRMSRARELRPELCTIPRHRAVQPREYLRFEITDINGKSLNKLIPMRHRDSKVYMYSAALALGSNSTVMTVPDEIAAAGCPNAELLPDWSTERHLPWASAAEGTPEEGVRVSRVLCEQRHPDGGRSHVPRAACRRLMAELAAFDGRGLQLLSSSELEFCVANRSCEPLFDGPEVFVTLQGTKTAGFQYTLEAQMEAVGVDVETMNAEYGAGQLEITFKPKFGIAGPDDTFTFRTGTKEIAQQRGFVATFAAKPFGLTGTGNGGHFNFSLWEPVQREQKVTPVLANSVIEHAPAMEALCAPTPGCYARHGNWAPIAANWGVDDRLAAVRVKLGRTAEQTYFEFRSPSSAANAYLIATAIVAAGLDGLERKLELPPERQSIADGAQPLPKSLEGALEVLLKDTYLVKRIGKDLVRWFVGVKMEELIQLRRWINDGLDSGLREDEATLKAWQKMYFEFI